MPGRGIRHDRLFVFRADDVHVAGAAVVADATVNPDRSYSIYLPGGG